MSDDLGFTDPYAAAGLKLVADEKGRELNAVRFAAQQRQVARAVRTPRPGLLRRVVRVIRGGGD